MLWNQTSSLEFTIRNKVSLKARHLTIIDIGKALKLLLDMTPKVKMFPTKPNMDINNTMGLMMSGNCSLILLLCSLNVVIAAVNAGSVTSDVALSMRIVVLLLSSMTSMEAAVLISTILKSENHSITF